MSRDTVRRYAAAQGFPDTGAMHTPVPGSALPSATEGLLAGLRGCDDSFADPAHQQRRRADGISAFTQTLNSEIVEFTKNGRFIAEFSIDSAAGAAFGIATAPAGAYSTRLAAVDDATNEVTVFRLGTP